MTTMTLVTPDTSDLSVKRQWLASLDLIFERKPTKTIATHIAHQGPLRVQRAFYPEKNDTCHIYILHPPGGLVIGDYVRLCALVKPNANALVTTPSAGRIYMAKGHVSAQTQEGQLQEEDQGYLEWLPQETIIYEGANAQINTQIHLQGRAKAMVWDCIRLGRRAMGERFESGYCLQNLEVYKDGRPYFIEKNRLVAGSKMINTAWGIRNASTLATCLATLNTTREQRDQWVAALDQMSLAMPSKDGQESLWGITQKPGMLIVRYLGSSITLCRQGLWYMWHQIRPLLADKQAVEPRIWHT